MVNNKSHLGDLNMPAESDRQMVTEREVVLAFNMGLQTAVYVLEKTEALSAEGRRFLIEELRKQIERSE